MHLHGLSEALEPTMAPLHGRRERGGGVHKVCTVNKRSQKMERGDAEKRPTCFLVFYARFFMCSF